MFAAYIIRSLKTGRFYIGSTSGLMDRLSQHNRGTNRSTKANRPWELAYWEYFESREEAYRREKQIKSYKSGRAFKALLQSGKNGEVA